MKGSGRFGKYGDLKRKQKIRQNRQAQTVHGYTHQAVPAGQDDRRKPHQAAKKEDPVVDARPPELDPEPSEKS
jgi:hypothetical protein